ncbi:MAG: hypothetical protein IJG68_07285 [Bacilli bacterium]|nr:hypothetical protein [Bacilli bacterium]
MNTGSITINSEYALEDAKQIDTIVASMEEDMQKLDRAINDSIADDPSQPQGIYTAWSTTLKQNWRQYCGADIPAAFADMKLSAKNLRLAVEKALGFSQEG